MKTVWSKPKTNVFYQKIETEGLVFTYQPELTQGEIDDGSYRPDSVVGSYAVYHTSKRHNYTVMEDWKPVQYAYLAGKAFHVYPGYTWDANYDSVKNIILIDTVSNIFSVEVNKFNLCYMRQDFPCLYKARGLSFRQVRLGDITCYNCLGVKTKACQEHFHLF